jgi:hypothetical protein
MINSIKRIACIILCAALLVSVFIVPVSAEMSMSEKYLDEAGVTTYTKEIKDVYTGEITTREYHSQSTNGKIHAAFGNVKFDFTPDDMFVVFRFYDDGSTAVYYAGGVAEEIFSLYEVISGPRSRDRNFGGFFSWQTLDPEYLRTGIELGYARLRYQTYTSVNTPDMIREMAKDYPDGIPHDVRFSITNRGSNDVIEGLMNVPVIDYNDVPEDMKLILVKTNYVAPPTAEEIAAQEYKNWLYEEAKTRDVAINLYKINPVEERVNYPLSYFVIGLDPKTETFTLLDKELNQLPMTQHNTEGLKDDTYGFIINPIDESIFEKAMEQKYLKAALYEGSRPTEIGYVECVDLNELGRIRSDILWLKDYPDTDIYLSSFLPTTLADKSIGVKYVTEDTAHLYLCDRDGNPLLPEGYMYNEETGDFFLMRALKDGHIDNSEENVAKVILDGIERGELNVFLEVRFPDEGEYHGVEYASVPVFVIRRTGTNTVKPLASVKLSSNVELSSSITLGDADGDGKLNAKDVVAVMKYITGWDVSISRAAADYNCDGKVNNRDLLEMMLAIVNG